ncbi:hypothetical protein [Variovorax atrisoli]|uniref:hypothetical protein n=1 Tax=Variovorax atrisoli TaxID=3394203 RepID=UPI003396DE44
MSLRETRGDSGESIFLGLLAKRGYSVMQARVRNKWVKAAAFVGDNVDPFVLHAFPASGGCADDAAEELRERLAKLKARLSQFSFD